MKIIKDTIVSEYCVRGYISLKPGIDVAERQRLVREANERMRDQGLELYGWPKKSLVRWQKYARQDELAGLCDKMRRAGLTRVHVVEKVTGTRKFEV